MVYSVNRRVFSGIKDAIIDPKDKYAIYIDKLKSNYKLGCISHFIFYTIQGTISFKECTTKVISG